VSDNPLLALAADRPVRLASEFQKAAADLTVDRLAEAWHATVAQAPRRAEAGKAFFEPHPARHRTRARERDREDLRAALVHHCRQASKPLWMPKVLPDEPDHTLDILDHHVPLKARREDTGVGHLDLVGLLDDRLAVGKVRYVAPGATRGATGDTPLRALLEGLADAAAAAASADAMRAELAERFERDVAEGPPALFLLATRRYWDLSRKRSVQRGAAWIKELERLGRELEETLDVPVRYLGLDMPGDPPWEIRSDGGQETPVFTQAPRLERAWEATAGRVKPRSRPKPKVEEKSQVVQADPGRAPRAYRPAESFAAGDRIQHATLGEGVVQGSAGPGKITVLFDGDRKILVHERS